LTPIRQTSRRAGIRPPHFSPRIFAGSITLVKIRGAPFRERFSPLSQIPLGVFLGGDELITINEDESNLLINHLLFRERFISCFIVRFTEIISNANMGYQEDALEYFALLTR